MSRFFLAITQGFLALILISCQRQPAVTNTPPPIDLSPVVAPDGQEPEGTRILPTLTRRLPASGQLPELATVRIVSASEEPVGLQMPAYLEAEVAGRSIIRLARLAGRYDDSGDRRLLSYDLLRPKTPYGEEEVWADGIHELLQVWYTEGDYLTDGENGDFAILWESELEATMRTVNGRYRSAGQNEYAEAVLFVNIKEGRTVEVVETATGMARQPEFGDEFQIANLMVVDDNQLESVPGVSLTFNEVGQLSYEKRPLPGGSYFLGLLAETESGDKASDFVNYTVGNENLRDGYRAYFDPRMGYQFLYPSDWIGIEIEENLLATRNISGTLQMTVNVRSDMDQGSISDLKSEVLSTFGNVKILYEDTAQIGATGALWTAYGYGAANGPHTGVFLVFSQDGWVFVVDIDGISERELEVLDIAGSLSESWVSRPVAIGQEPGSWTPAELNGFRIMVPSELNYALLNNGWHRFTSEDGSILFAMRSEPAADGPILDRVRHWLDVAAKDVTDFAFSDIYAFDLDGKSWLRIDFAYQRDDGIEMAGSLMAIRIEEAIVFSWAESPVAGFDALEQERILLSLASLRRIK